MNNVKSVLKNEKGNIALFVIGILSVMMILFVLVFNLAKVYASKEQASTTAQQASLAATSVFYEEIWQAIDDYEKSLIGTIGKLPESVVMKVEKKKLKLAGDSSYSGYSSNELSLEALDLVLTEELNNGIGKDKLAKTLTDDIEFRIKPLMKQAAREAILDNDGELEDAEIELFKNGQVYVKASNEVQSTPFKGLLNGVKENLFQTTGGPKIKFIDNLPNWINRTESLE